MDGSKRRGTSFTDCSSNVGSKMNSQRSSKQCIPFKYLLVIQILLLFNGVAAQGRDCQIGSFDNGSACEKCRPGTFQDEVGSTSCKKCPAGTFTSSRGVVSKELCLECPEDSNSEQGASKCFRCPRGQIRRCGECKSCPKGSFFDGCDCRKCFVGTFTVEDNQSDCVDCPAGMASNEARTKCIDGGCPPGFQFDFGDCLDCNSFEFGYLAFKNESTGLCQTCPPRTTILDFQAPAIKCEKCPPGMFLTDILVGTAEQLPVCEPCPPGTRTVGFGKPLCREVGKPCPDNTFEDEDGDCQVCDPSFRLDRKNKRCVECKANEVLDSFSHLLTKCRECAPGQIRAFDKCTCPDGEEFRDGRCRKCRPGTASTFGANCDRCGEGEFSREGAAECTPCPPGTTSRLSKGRRCERIGCPKGLIQPPLFTSNFERCISPVTGCPRGLIGLGFKRGVFLCGNTKGEVVCPRGHIFNRKDECITCSEGWRIVETKRGTLTCRPCPRTMPISRGGATRRCKACQNGFRAGFPASKCVCGLGRFIDKNGRCRRCPSGPFPKLPLKCLFLN